MKLSDNFKLRQLTKIIMKVIFLSLALVFFSHAAMGQGESTKLTKKLVKHQPVRFAKNHRPPKHILKVDLSDAPSENELEPLAIGQKVSEKLVLGSVSSGSSFGTAAEGRFPASVNEESTQLMSKKSKNTLSTKLNSRDLKKMLQSMRQKTEQSFREEYD